MGATLNITASEVANSVSIANNTSKLSVKLTITTNNDTFNLSGDTSGSITINGKAYSLDGKGVNKNTTTTLYSGTHTITHNDDGSKTVAISAKFDVNTSVRWINASKSVTLTTIPRKSSLSIADGTLGVPQILTVTKQASAFTHTITYECGTAIGTICSKSSATSISWTPPAGLASQVTNTTEMLITYTITTYNCSTNIGSDIVQKKLIIPDTEQFRPKCTISVEEVTDYIENFGCLVQGHSRLRITVTPELAYGALIATYATSVNGATYKDASFETGVLGAFGTLTIISTVTDGRGLSNTASTTVEVVEYYQPKITSLTVHRCDSDGTPNDEGGSVLVVFSYDVAAINDQNTSYSYAEYKKTSETEFSEPIETYLDDNFSVSGESIIIPEADTGSSYDIALIVSDHISSTRRQTVVSTAFTLQHWKADGTGIGIGKISELPNVLDIALLTRHKGGILQDVLEPGMDFDSLMVPNTYTLKECSGAEYVNCPMASGTGTLKIETCGEDERVHQIVSGTNKTNPIVWERFYHDSSWGSWVCTSVYGGKLLWSGSSYMGDGARANLSGLVSEQTNGILLVFSPLSQDYQFNHIFVHKRVVASHPGVGHSFMMTSDGTFSVLASKYLYIHDGYINGTAANSATGTGASGVKYENNKFVLRYVIGV